MTSFFRRPGAVLATFVKTAADPAAVPNQYILYSKDDAYGNTQVFGRPDVGAILQLTPGEVIRYAGNPNGALSAAIYSLSIDPATGIRYVNTDGAVAWSVWAPGSFTGIAGSIPFVSATGVLTQDNPGLVWNTTDKRLVLLSNHATNGPLFVQSTSGTGPSALGVIDATDGTSSIVKSYWGWFSGGYALAYLQNRSGVYSVNDGPFIIGGTVAKALEVGVVSGSAFLEVTDGIGAAVGAAGTARIKYDNTAKTLKLSLDGAAYVTFVTI